MNPSFRLYPDGKFVITNYHEVKPFCNFFPGIAGVWGTPLWLFYVNRGQCIASFGVESKDKSILEFQPANKAYRSTNLQGFRTFLKIGSGNKTQFYEPFQRHSAPGRRKISQSLAITAYDLTLCESNPSLGLALEVNYFTLAQEPHAALIRRLRLTNLTKKNRSIELIDGLPAIVPYGTNDWALKNMSRTLEAWMTVKNLKAKAPYYHLHTVISDKPAIEDIEEGNFYFAFAEGRDQAVLLEPIIEAEVVFGRSEDFRRPEKFYESNPFKIPKTQHSANRTPSAMSFGRFNLGPHASKEIYSLTGYAVSEADLNRLVKRATKKDFLKGKARGNGETIEQIQNYAFTHSSNLALDFYVKQTFLDNVMRGGLPVSFMTEEGAVAFNVFSRKHGDPERDYNYFVLAPTYFSQGNGNYRDVNQNRRNDVWFHQDVKESTIVNFLSLLQADGYNPLVVKGMTFTISDSSKVNSLLRECVRGETQALRSMLCRPFQPGEILRAATADGLQLKVPLKEFLILVLGAGHKNESADHGEGFWIDHWAYNLDLIESYLSIYPDEWEALFCEKRVFTFYHNAHYVLPRDERYILTTRGVRQYHSVKDGTKEIKTIHKDNRLRVKNGEGPIYHAQLLGKLLSVVANKAATFDPGGVGIEMEADKPGWYDPLNGLPGLLGSSLCETIELKRWALFLLDHLKLIENKSLSMAIFQELAEFLNELTEVLENEKDDLAFWMNANDLKEHYREKVRFGIDGHEEEVGLNTVRHFLELVVAKTERAVRKVEKPDGTFPSYFFYSVSEYERLDKEFLPGQPFVWPKQFTAHSLPLFLEGFVHALRVETDLKAARRLYQSVRQSDLFDQQLKMYKVNTDLKKEAQEIGRCHIFPSGWLENESVWLHMEYKYLLELLRCGLYEEFFQDLKQMGVPFLDPAVYGRSILENSSFIVSSAHPDERLHGQGFVARLSGSTAEFLHMWLLMSVGPKPFSLNSRKELELCFKPALAGWLFTFQESRGTFFDRKHKKQTPIFPKNTYAFMFLGSILTVYHNPQMKNTFGKAGVSVKEIHLCYPTKKTVVINSPLIPAPYAQEIRNRRLERIEIFLE